MQHHLSLNDFTLTFLAICGVLALGGTALLIHSSTRQYAKKNYAMLLWTLEAALLATLVGTWAGVKDALHFEDAREQQEQRDIFSYKLAALSFETRGNLYLIEGIRQAVTSQGVDIRELRTDAAQKVIEDFVTYKDGRQDLFEAVWAMVAAIDEVNNITDVLIDNVEEKRKHAPRELEAVQMALDRATRCIQAVRTVLEQSRGEYPPSDVWKEPTPGQIKELLGG